MAIFTVTGDVDPFLHVSLSCGESIFCESDAMVMMEDPLDLVGRMQGGFLQSVLRRFANGESFFQQQITASRGDGECLLSPQIPGGMEILDVGNFQYCISDNAYVAATDGVQVTAQMQSLGNAIFGGTGGFFIGRSSGHGQLVVSGFGSIFSIECTNNKSLIIDNGHVVAWDSSLKYELSVASRQSQSMFGSVLNSVTSGEGIILKFTGQGRVVVCSRNRVGFLAWIKAGLGLKKS